MCLRLRKLQTEVEHWNGSGRSRLCLLWSFDTFGLGLIWTCTSTCTWILTPLPSVVCYKKLGYLIQSAVPHFLLWERGRLERFSLRCLKLATASFISAWWAVFVPECSTGHPSAHAHLCHKDTSSVSTMTLSVHYKGTSSRELPLYRSNSPKYLCDSFSKIHKLNFNTCVQTTHTRFNVFFH